MYIIHVHVNQFLETPAYSVSHLLQVGRRRYRVRGVDEVEDHHGGTTQRQREELRAAVSDDRVGAVLLRQSYARGRHDARQQPTTNHTPFRRQLKTHLFKQAFLI